MKGKLDFRGAYRQWVDRAKAGRSKAEAMRFAIGALTHLLHEQSYLYLQAPKRVLKPGGRIVFSFLEFRMPFHWSVFASTVDDARGSYQHPLNVFIERNAIEAWASHLGLAILDMRDGDDVFVPLSRPVTLDSGQVLSQRGSLGQSICVLGLEPVS